MKHTVVTPFTRLKASTLLINWLLNLLEDSSKCIELILSSVHEKHKLCDVAEVALSDHYMISTCIDFNVKTYKHKTIRFRDYKMFDSDLFLRDIERSAVFKNY